MEKWLLVDTSTKKWIILDSCLTTSREKAQSAFDGDGWIIGEVMSEADFLNEVPTN